MMARPKRRIVTSAMFLCFVVLLCSWHDRLAYAQGGGVPKIEFDGKEGDNPSSPKVGRIKAVGTFDLKGADFVSVKSQVRRKLTEDPPTYDGWIDVEVSRDGNSWLFDKDNFMSTKFQVRATLTYTVKNPPAPPQTKSVETEPYREVTVK